MATLKAFITSHPSPLETWGIGARAGTIPLVLFVILDGLRGLPAFRVSP